MMVTRLSSLQTKVLKIKASNAKQYEIKFLFDKKLFK